MTLDEIKTYEPQVGDRVSVGAEFVYVVAEALAGGWLRYELSKNGKPYAEDVASVRRFTAFARQRATIIERGK